MSLGFIFFIYSWLRKDFLCSNGKRPIILVLDFLSGFALAMLIFQFIPNKISMIKEVFLNKK